MPALTGLRGMAALWVLVYHAWVYVTPKALLFTFFGEPVRAHVFISLGWAGVQVLFVLSAFLLTLPYARANAGLAERPRIPHYLLKRFARVFPAYYLQLLLLVIIAWLFSGEYIVKLSDTVEYLFMLFVPPPVGVGAPTSVNGVWWTLPIELSFYLVLPLIASLAAWNRKTLLILVSLVTMVVWRYYIIDMVQPSNNVHMWMYQLPGSMDSFGLGMIGAIIHVQYTESRRSSKGYQVALGVLLCIVPLIFLSVGVWMAEEFASYWTKSPILFLWTPIFSAGVLIVILNAARNQALVNTLLGNRVVLYLGTISYGIYLWHPPIGGWLLSSPLIRNMDTYQFPRLALLMFLASVFAATISWFLVEKKAIALLKKNGNNSA